MRPHVEGRGGVLPDLEHSCLIPGGAILSGGGGERDYGALLWCFGGPEEVVQGAPEEACDADTGVREGEDDGAACEHVGSCGFVEG